MNIKEIIDAERWAGGYDSNYNHVDGHTAEVFYSDHNTSIARIEKAVAKHVDELEADKAELEYALKTYESAVELKDKRIAELADLLVESGERIKKQSERIAELESQVSGYAHVLDDAYDGYMSASSTEELVEVLKEVIEYAPRRER